MKTGKSASMKGILTVNHFVVVFVADSVVEILRVDTDDDTAASVVIVENFDADPANFDVDIARIVECVLFGVVVSVSTVDVQDYVRIVVEVVAELVDVN